MRAKRNWDKMGATMRAALAFSGALLIAAAAIALLMSGLAPPHWTRLAEADDDRPQSMRFRAASFAQLPGWPADDAAAAFAAFRVSCARIEKKDPDEPLNASENIPGADGSAFAGSAGPLIAICAEANALSPERYADDAARRAATRGFFQTHFVPLQILSYRAANAERPERLEEAGLFTGYFEPIYEARRRRSRIFSAPVLSRPKDLVEIDLARFREEWRGERLFARLEGHDAGTDIAPYPDHAAINETRLVGAAEPLAWMRPDDLFFMQIQGSGRARFQDGSELRLGYAGANGRPYFAIGRALVARGAFSVEDASMAAIRDWLAAASPEEARAIREMNPSYVFFRALGEASPEEAQRAPGPLGAQGAPLTPGRSLAVDRRYHALGLPMFVDLAATDDRPAIRSLMIAQDTGGAIRGPVRGDVFWGAGDDAGAAAGAMKDEGRLYVLWPREALADLSGGWRID